MKYIFLQCLSKAPEGQTDCKVCLISFDPSAVPSPPPPPKKKIVFPNTIMSLFFLNHILMAHFLKQSFA